MKRLLIAILFTTLCLPTAQAQQAVLAGARIAAEDPAALAEFYKAVFGMQELNRTVDADGTEVMLSFNDPGPDMGPILVLVQRPSDDIEITMPHHIFATPDIRAVMEAVTTAGGQLLTPEPMSVPQGDSQVMIGIVRDVAGNILQFVQGQ